MDYQQAAQVQSLLQQLLMQPQLVQQPVQQQQQLLPQQQQQLLPQQQQQLVPQQPQQYLPQQPQPQQIYGKQHIQLHQPSIAQQQVRIIEVPSDAQTDGAVEVTAGLRHDLKEAVRKSLGEFNQQASETCANLSKEVSESIRAVSMEARNTMQDFVNDIKQAKIDALAQWKEIAKDASVSADNCKKRIEEASSEALGSILLATDEAVSKINKCTDTSINKLKQLKPANSFTNLGAGPSKVVDSLNSDAPSKLRFTSCSSASAAGTSKQGEECDQEEDDEQRWLGESVVVHNSDSDEEDAPHLHALVKSKPAAKPIKPSSSKSLQDVKHLLSLKQEALKAKYPVKKRSVKVIDSDDEDGNLENTSDEMSLAQLKKLKKDDLIELFQKQQNGRKANE